MNENQATSSLIPHPSSLIPLLLVALWLIAHPAVIRAHAELVAAEPAPGAQAELDSLREVRLTFNEPITADSQITLLGDNFQTVPGVTSRHDPQSPAQLTATVLDLVPGVYTVQWTAVSLDGHPVSGSYNFRVGVTNSSAGLPLPLWQWVVIILISLIVVAILWRRWQPPTRDVIRDA